MKPRDNKTLSLIREISILLDFKLVAENCKTGTKNIGDSARAEAMAPGSYGATIAIVAPCLRIGTRWKREILPLGSFGLPHVFVRVYVPHAHSHASHHILVYVI